jgi:hypothetical protein
LGKPVLPEVYWMLISVSAFTPADSTGASGASGASGATGPKGRQPAKQKRKK